MHFGLFFLFVYLTVMQTLAQDLNDVDQQIDSTEPSQMIDLDWNTRWRLANDDDNLVDIDDSENEWNRIQNKRFLSLFRNRPPKSEGYKRGPGFRSWGGKRGDKLFEGGKRRPFQSWGGKRNLNDDFLSEQEKRKFSSWGGKRSYTALEKASSKKKPSFLSWGGKRSDEFVIN